MANGPHSADDAQRYILQTMRSLAPEEFEHEVDHTESFNGTEEWSAGEVFENGVLKEFDEEEPETIDETPEYGFKALDQIYGVIDTTKDSQGGYKRLEGLRALKTGWEFPVQGRTQRDWIQNFREAGLIWEEDDTIEMNLDTGAIDNIRPSPEGEVFLDTDPRNYFFIELGVENVGEVYRELSTRKMSDEPTGQKLEALFLYAGGLSHSEVSEATGMARSTARNFAQNMNERHGVLSEDYRLTQEGYEFANMVLDQMDRLEYATNDRVNALYDNWEDVEPEDFGGNGYVARAMKQRKI